MYYCLFVICLNRPFFHNLKGWLLLPSCAYWYLYRKLRRVEDIAAIGIIPKLFGALVAHIARRLAQVVLQCTQIEAGLVALALVALLVQRVRFAESDVEQGLFVVETARGAGVPVGCALYVERLAELRLYHEIVVVRNLLAFVQEGNDLPPDAEFVFVVDGIALHLHILIQEVYEFGELERELYAGLYHAGSNGDKYDVVLHDARFEHGAFIYEAIGQKRIALIEQF